MNILGTYLVPILVALIAAAGTWTTILAVRAQRRRNHEDTLNRRNIRLINYAARLREQLEAKGVDPEPWPDNLYDSDGAT